MPNNRVLQAALGVALLPFVAIVGPAQGVTAQPDPHGAGAGAESATAALSSPEVHPDGRVTFHISASKAGAVTVTGDWMDRGASPPQLAEDDHGVWSVTIGPLAADIYSYSFTVDGVRTLDPENTWIRPSIDPPDMQFV